MFVVFLSSKYYEPLVADVPRWSKDHNQSALDGFSILHCDSVSSTFLHGLSGRNMWNSFDMLIHASTTRKVICSFELSLFSCLLTFVYQLIVKSMRAFVYRCLLLLWSVEPFYSGMIRRNKLHYLFHIQDWVKVVVFRRSKCQSSCWFCSTWSITHFMSGMSWGLHLLLWILDVVILLAIIVHSLAPVLF